MFGTTNGKETKTKKAPATPGLQSSNSLVQGTRLEGTITTESDIRIDGTLVGSVKSKGKVIIGPSGHIEGDIQCRNAVIEGRFEGNLQVNELLQVKDSAHVEGDVRTKKLIVQSGSVFNVNCSMGAQKVKDKNLGQSSQALELQNLAKVVNKS